MLTALILFLVVVVITTLVFLPRINYGLPMCHCCRVIVKRPALFCEQCRQKLDHSWQD